jgi:hypothetical protein
MASLGPGPGGPPGGAGVRVSQPECGAGDGGPGPEGCQCDRDSDSDGGPGARTREGAETPGPGRLGSVALRLTRPVRPESDSDRSGPARSLETRIHATVTETERAREETRSLLS